MSINSIGGSENWLDSIDKILIIIIFQTGHMEKKRARKWKKEENLVISWRSEETAVFSTRRQLKATES